MSKNSEIAQYLLINPERTADSMSLLNQQGRIIFGDLSNRRIYAESNILMPKEGILILEDDFMAFYGSKSLLEKEYLLKIAYEDLSLLYSPAFTIHFMVQTPNEKVDKCKFSIAWEDYIYKNTKAIFLDILAQKIPESLYRKATDLANAKRFDETALFYYSRIFKEKLVNLNFLQAYLEAFVERAKTDSYGYSNIYTKTLNDKKEYLLAIYSDKESQGIINSLLSFENHGINQEDNLEFFHSYYHDYIYFDDSHKIAITEAITHPGIQKMIKDKVHKEVMAMRLQLEQEFQAKDNRLAEKLEIEKNIYREIIRDNIILADKFNFSKDKCEDIVSSITDFYYRYKVLKDKLPDHFVIDRQRPQEGISILRFLLEGLSLDYLKVCDPYLFATELDLFYEIPSNINLSILTFAVYQNREKLDTFVEKLTKLRQNRLGKVAVKIVLLKNRSNSIIHDRVIFSKDWGISLSNSLSQIGASYDISCQRLYNHQSSEVELFDDYWFAHQELKINGKKMSVTIIDL